MASKPAGRSEFVAAGDWGSFGAHHYAARAWEQITSADGCRDAARSVDAAMSARLSIEAAAADRDAVLHIWAAEKCEALS